MIFLAISFAFFSVYMNLLMDAEEKILCIQDERNCRDYIKAFLKLSTDIEKLLVVRKYYQYNVFSNTIGIPNIESVKIIDIIKTLHEAGHYSVLNKYKIKFEVYKISQIVISINRLFIIPLIMIMFIFLGEVCRLAVAFCLIATLLRIVIGITNEYEASRIAFNFLKSRMGYEYIKIAKKIYIICFLNQLFMTFSIGFLMLALYYPK